MNYLATVRSSFGSVALFVLTALAAPVQALEARILPNNPRLGDTLSVIIETDSMEDSPPTLTVNGEMYPAFGIGTNRFRAFVPTTPLESPGQRTIQIAGEGEEKSVAVEIGDRDFPIQEIWLSPEVNAIQGTDYEFDRVDAFKSLVTPQQWWKGLFQDPTEGPVTTVYGVRRYYNGEWAGDYYHRGMDYAAPMGAPVYAAAPGRVSLVGRVSEGFELHGNSVGIDHGQGVTTMYIHLSEITVSEGQMVRSGDLIGRVGSTGISTGPHLHWGLYVYGESVDPVPWLERGFK